MVLEITFTIGGADYSKLFMSSHSEHTTNDSKDENKYDAVLANGGGSLFGKFKPMDEMILAVDNVRATCEGTTTEHIHIFTGQVQKVTCDETECHISGSCKQGGMVSAVPKPFTWYSTATITEIVEDLVFAYMGDIETHIHPANDKPTQHTPESGEALDFNTAIQMFADEAGCSWFFDEHGEFWFIPADYIRGNRDLTNHVLQGQTASTMVGLCTIVDVYGASQATPDDPRSNNPTHWKVHSRIRADDPAIIEAMQGNDMIAGYGELYAPPITVPNCDQKTCDQIARNVLLWFLQFADVPQVKVEGIAPFVFTRVAYQPFNGQSPPISCDAGQDALAAATIMGTVTKRVVDISPDVGLECTLDVSTNYNGNMVGRDIYNDEDIANQYPGAWPVNEQ